MVGILDASTNGGFMKLKDIEILERCINKEGFIYAMLCYSSYDESSPEHNRVSDERFHELRLKLRCAHDELADYLRDEIDSPEL